MVKKLTVIILLCLFSLAVAALLFGCGQKPSTTPSSTVTASESTETTATPPAQTASEPIVEPATPAPAPASTTTPASAPQATPSTTPQPETTTTTAPEPVAPTATNVPTIAFMRYTNDSWDEKIFLIRADGTGLKQLTLEKDMRENFPRFSPDGKKIAFGRWPKNGNADIYLMNPDGTGRTRLTDNPAHDDMPAWSPDGKSIAFMSMRDGNMEIYVMAADGSGQKRLTSDASRDLLPVWSPDGSQIAFLSNREGVNRWWVMKADGSDQRLLADIKVWDESISVPAILLQATWSRSFMAGEFFAPLLTKEEEGVISLKIADGTRGSLTFGDSLNLVEAPDGSLVLTTFSSQTRSLDLVLMFAGPVKRLTNSVEQDIAGSCAVISPP